MMKTGSHRWNRETESATIGVVKAVAAATDVQPEAIEPLYGSVDGDALNSLLERGDDVCVTFPYAGFDVEVRATTVQLTAPADDGG
ncbi:HalOD1 output domain-containing protein [Natronosalvus vescus]|uniref:HalOD1 output domain-containing protein n=1 Tax=Natronosalvus vescus TaxID=2953881 RepID=UPI0020900820|nr:HalOD1 output domain-containing protein [Natronosalvus vescus]